MRKHKDPSVVLSSHPQELQSALSRAFCTFLFHIVRTPDAKTRATASVHYMNVNHELSQRVNLIQPEQYLGVIPSLEIAEAIATGKCNLNPPYEMYEPLEPDEQRPVLTPLTPSNSKPNLESNWMFPVIKLFLSVN